MAGLSKAPVAGLGGALMALGLLGCSLPMFFCVPAYAGDNVNGNTFSASAQTTYGGFSNSLERDFLVSESVNLLYGQEPDNGMTLHLSNSQLRQKPPLPPINGTHFTFSVYDYFQKNPEFDLGAKSSITFIKSSDPASNDGTVAYGALLYRVPDGSAIYDLGYASTGYKTIAASQLTLTAGFSLFEGWSWSQTRLYAIGLNRMVNGRRNSFAVEEKLTYYTIPKKLTLTLYGLLGERIYAYDPDLMIPYTLPDLQQGSAGLSAYYNLSEDWNLYGDLTYESYRNEGLNNTFGATYATLGLHHAF